jgi:hypothetical protein
MTEILTKNILDVCRIYICRTPYHVFLSSVEEQNKERGKSTIIIDPWFPDKLAENLVGSLGTVEVFDYVYKLKSIYGKKSKLKFKNQLCTIRENMSHLDNFLTTIDADLNGKLYTTSVSKEVDQLSINRLCKHGDWINIHIEDGMALYRKSISDNWAKLSRIRNVYKSKNREKEKHRIKIAKQFEFWWKPITKPEESDNIEIIKAVFPDLVRDSLSSFEVQSFPDPLQSDNEITRLSNHFIRNSIVDFPTLLLLPHSYGLKENESKIIKNCIERFDTRVGIKPHPREVDHYYQDYQGEILPGQIPAEFLYASDQLSISSVIGGATTAMYTAKWIRENLESVCYSSIIKDDDNIDRRFESVGVLYPEDLNSLFSRLCE